MIQDIPALIDPALLELKAAFATHKTISLEYRKAQLTSLVKGITALEKEFHLALQKDLGVSEFGSLMTSTLITKMDVEHTLEKFAKWSKPTQVKTPLVIGPASSKIAYDPLGVVLVISSWNYPLYTSIPAVAAAISAGNCVVLKPSELAPYSSNVLAKLFDQYLDKDCYRVIEGGPQVAQQITTKPFDLIIFTGSPDKGKLVAKAAAENLIPCILELGGKNPTIVDKDASLVVSAARIAQGRYLNAGQTCVACDYILVHEDIKDAFIKELVKQTKSFFGEDAQKSADYSRIISSLHTERLASMIDVQDHKGKIVYGGRIDVQDRYVEPTIIENPDKNSKVMNEEIFGPILPIVTYRNFNDAIKTINSRPKPLSLYYFGHNSTHKEQLEKFTSSGQLSFNDVAYHLLNPNLPFGGVGNSGYSAYHGIYGFRNCSHHKPVVDKSTLNLWPLNTRYPPFSPARQRLLLFLFKNTQFSTKAATNGFIVVVFLIAANIARSNPRTVQSVHDKVAPFLTNIWRQLPGL